jgi:hypothetical protein
VKTRGYRPAATQTRECPITGTRGIFGCPTGLSEAISLWALNWEVALL